MLTLTTLKSSMSSARKTLEGNDNQLAEQAVWNMCEVFKQDFNITDEKDYSPELALIQYQCLDIVMDLHIRRGDPLDVSVRAAQFMMRFRQETEHFPQWNKEDWEPIQQVVIGLIDKTHKFTQKRIFRDYKPKKRDASCTCALCHRNRADKTGSHMVPHLLIADVFSYDGSRGRDKVTVGIDALGEGKSDRYFGHQVYEDTIKGLIGRELTDEELDVETKKTNVLTIDHIFCSECEKRLGVIESWYAEILAGAKEYPPQVPYLFWMSVIWRMAVGKMGMVLDVQHQEKLRRTLDKCLALRREDIELRNSKLGHCAYSLYKADDTRDESLGIFGTHEQTKPYQAIMGRYFINFYNSLSAAKSFIKANHLPLEDLNDGTQKEKIGTLNFIEFWSVKRQILDLAWKNGRSIWNIGRNPQKTLFKMDSYTGAYTDTNDIPLWMNSQNPMVACIPRALWKMENWAKEHKDNLSIEQMSKDLGYSPDEMKVMIDYWEKTIDSSSNNVEEGDEVTKAFDELLNILVL